MFTTTNKILITEKVPQKYMVMDILGQTITRYEEERKIWKI